MMQELGIAILLLLAARGYFACASDLGRMFKVHFCEAPAEDEHDTTEQLSKRSTTITSPPSYGFRVVEK